MTCQNSLFLSGESDTFCSMKDSLEPRRRHCPYCGLAIHPLDLAKLHRGRNLACSNCRSRLKAQSFGLSNRIFGTAAALLPMTLDYLGDGSAALSSLVFAGVIMAIFWIAPPGLVAGGSWVKITAEPPRPVREHAD